MARFKSFMSFQDFKSAVQFDLRYVRSPENEKFLKTILETATPREVTLKENSIFWRAQLGHDWREETQDNITFKVKCPLSRNRMKPHPDRAVEGRANPKGIPCLYVSTTKATAIHEVRPWIGSYVSVGQFKLVRELKVVNCAHNHDTPIVYSQGLSDENIEIAVWSDIDRAFAEPLTHAEDTAKYAATQVIAESFKKEGLDGIVYRSNFGKGGYNIALFEIDVMELVSNGPGLYKVDAIKTEFSRCL